MAEYPGFVSVTYPARSFAVSVDRLVNFFPEVVESKLGKSAIYYLPTPGLLLVHDASALGAGRGMFALDGRQFAVIGKWLVEFGPYGSYTQYPNAWDVPQAFLEDDGKPVTIVANSRTPPQLEGASSIKPARLWAARPLQSQSRSAVGSGGSSDCRMEHENRKPVRGAESTGQDVRKVRGCVVHVAPFALRTLRTPHVNVRQYRTPSLNPRS